MLNVTDLLNRTVILLNLPVPVMLFRKGVAVKRPKRVLVG